MDPDQLLENIRNEIEICQGEDAERLGELFLSLDEWLCKGGFLPKEWQNVGHKREA